MDHLISDNFLAHFSRIPAKTNGMLIQQSDHLTYIDSALSCDTFNIIYIHSPNATKSEIGSAVEHFRARHIAFCLWIAKENLSPQVEQTLADLGLKKQASEEGMILKLDNYEIQAAKVTDSIVEVKNPDLLQEYADVIAKNWSPPDTNILAYYSKTASHYLNPEEKIILLAYYDGNQPVSTVEMFPTDDSTIGLYGFATLETHRGQGIGTSLMTFCLNKAKELGYQYVILQGTEDGLGIYQKHGFEAVTTYFEYA